jgi:putative transposase
MVGYNKLKFVKKLFTIFYMSKLFPKNEIFHVFNKSIANFGIFKDLDNCQRFIDTLDYYNNIFSKKSLSDYLRINKNFFCSSLLYQKENSHVKFIAYCIMPDHYHLLIKTNQENTFPKYIADVENSFTRFFNIKFKRKGPLWQSAFKAVRIKNNEQLLHVSRYIHLNPTTNALVDDPKDWRYSSYNEYINNERILKNYANEISINTPVTYKKFVEDRKDYQRKLKMIKKLIFE